MGGILIQENLITMFLNTQSLGFGPISSTDELKNDQSGAGARNLLDRVQKEAFPKPSSPSSHTFGQDATSPKRLRIG